MRLVIFIIMIICLGCSWYQCCIKSDMLYSLWYLGGAIFAGVSIMIEKIDDLYYLITREIKDEKSNDNS